MSIKPHMKQLILILLSVNFLLGIYLIKTTKEALEYWKDGHFLQSSLEAKSEACMKKAARYANAVDPRYYTESTVKNVYKNCLEQ